MIIAPTRKQVKDWYDIIAQYGCAVTGSMNFQIHHPVGRSYVKDKLRVGEVFCYPLAVELHDASSNHPLNVTHHRKAFVAEYGREADIFLTMVQELESLGIHAPFDAKFLDKIAEVDR